MFHRILVALDESENREHVFDAAIALAQDANTQLRLLHVITMIEPDFPRSPLAMANVGFVVDETVYEEVLQRYAQEQQEFEKHHLSLLHDISRDPQVKDIFVDYCLAYGDPGKEICDLARKWKADAIVLGRRGNVGMKEFFLGSVSNYVVHYAPCAVLVVQEGKTAKAASCMAA